MKEVQIMVDGKTNKRTTLTATVVKSVVFEGTFKQMTLAKNGTGKVAFKVNDDVVDIDDTSANILNDDLIGIVIERTDQIFKVLMVSDTDVEMQWDYDTVYRG